MFFFIFGHSLAENERSHTLRMARGRFPKLYVGIYGDPNFRGKPRNQFKRSEKFWLCKRHEKWPLESLVFTMLLLARVWGMS